MCDSCASRADQLRQLARCFEVMADQAIDPAEIARLRHTATDLVGAAGLLPADCSKCGAGDVVWADDPPNATATG